MTLGDLFNLLSQNPAIILFFFIAVPLTAILAGIFGRGEGHLNPWKYLYCILIYLTMIPGIFAITLNVYTFLFERQSIYNTNLYTQILPLISMIVTILIIRRNVDLIEIPGFDRLSGLVLLLTAIISFMWILDRTHIIAIAILPFQWVLILFLILLVAIRFGWKQLMR